MLFPHLVRRSTRISIHSLRMEGDDEGHVTEAETMTFQSTPSAWRETLSLGNYNTCKAFQSTPSAWRETLVFLYILIHRKISIHSLRMEGDTQPRAHTVTAAVISIHSLRMEGDAPLRSIFPFSKHFNPLPPHGGRQSILLRITSSGSFQSTPSAWRETQ